MHHVDTGPRSAIGWLVEGARAIRVWIILLGMDRASPGGRWRVVALGAARLLALALAAPVAAIFDGLQETVRRWLARRVVGW